MERRALELLGPGSGLSNWSGSAASGPARSQMLFARWAYCKCARRYGAAISRLNFPLFLSGAQSGLTRSAARLANG